MVLFFFNMPFGQEPFIGFISWLGRRRQAARLFTRLAGCRLSMILSVFNGPLGRDRVIRFILVLVLVLVLVLIPILVVVLGLGLVLGIGLGADYQVLKRSVIMRSLKDHAARVRHPTGAQL